MRRFVAIVAILVLSTCILGNDVFNTVVRTKSELCEQPKKFKNAKDLPEGTLITIIDTTKILGLIYGKESPWVKIRTHHGDTGYVLLGETATVEGFKKEKKSILEIKNKPVPDFKGYISKSYTNIKQFDSLLHSVEFIAMDSIHSLTSYAYGDNGNCIVFAFAKRTGYSGQTPLNKLLDVLIIDKQQLKDSKVVSLRDCTTDNPGAKGSIIGVYSVKNSRGSGSGEYVPQEAWLANVRTEKIEIFSARECKCGPEPVGR
jgi:hypothetical protein